MNIEKVYMIDSNRILKINTVRLNKKYTMTELVKEKRKVREDKL